MAQSVSDLLTSLTPSPPVETLGEKKEVNPATLPFWVVVVSPRRSPPQPKYYFGYATEGEANAKRDELNESAVELAEEQTDRKRRDALNRGQRLASVEPVEPFKYYVISRPVGGVL